MSDRDQYKDKYGSWAGNPAGRKPDYKLCCFEVFPSGRGGIWHQCNKKRGFGPDGAYCKIHDPDYVEMKRKKEHKEYVLKTNKQRYQWHGKNFFDALEVIANGHNDPRSLAVEVIDKFKSGEIK